MEKRMTRKRTRRRKRRLEKGSESEKWMTAMKRWRSSTTRRRMGKANAT